MPTLYDRLHDAWEAYDGFDRDTTQLILDLYRAHTLVDAHVARVLAPFGLSVSAFNILMLLTAAPDGISLHHLSDMLVVSRTNVTRLVQALVEKGLVTRDEDPADRRVRIARITRRGIHLADRMLPTHLAAMRDMLGGMRAPEKQRLSRMLGDLQRVVKPE